MPQKAEGNIKLVVQGVSRDVLYERCLVVYLNREPTDDEMRAIHDKLRDEVAVKQ